MCGGMAIIMKSEKTEKHRFNTADAITLLRIAGTLGLVILIPSSATFFCVYTLTGLTDVLDGWIARKTKTSSDFGARLDSIADLLFYVVVLFRIFPIIENTLPGDIWYAVAVIVIVRISAYLTAMVKYHRFASLHTYLNKLMGMAVFLIPFMLITQYAVGYCFAVSAVAAIASLEELVIHLMKPNYNADTKSVF